MVVIVISGLSGTGKTAVAKALAKHLGLEYFSVSDSLREIYPREKELIRIVKIWRNYNVTKSMQMKFENMQIQMARKGNVVIDGEIAIYILRNVPSFKVWLEADREKRIERIAKRDGISPKEVGPLLNEKEKYEENFFHKLYGISVRSLDAYADLVIDTTFLPIEEVVNKIIRVMPK